MGTVKESNLHKEGGKLVYENIGIVRDNPVNLVVTVVEGTKYSTTKPAKNGKWEGGKFGSINLMTKKLHQQEDGLYDGTGNFQFCFHDSKTNDLVEVDSFQWSVYDLDERNHKADGIKEKLIMDVTQASDYMLYPNTEGSEVKLSCEDGSVTLPCAPGVRTVFHSSTKGSGKDNPTDPDNMGEQQLKRSIVFGFENKSCWTYTYSHYCPPDVADPVNSKGCSWYGGGNFQFAVRQSSSSKKASALPSHRLLPRRTFPRCLLPTLPNPQPNPLSLRTAETMTTILSCPLRVRRTSPLKQVGVT